MTCGVTRRDPKKESFWRRMMKRHSGSGMSIRAWCRQHDVKESAFHWWRRELARRDAETSEATVAKKTSFVPVRVTDDAVVPKAPSAMNHPDDGSMIEVVLPNGHCVRLRGSVDRRRLVDVLDVLERRAC